MRYLTLVVTFAIIFSFTNGAPQLRRHRRHWYGPLSLHDGPYHPFKSPWVNSCGFPNDTLGFANHRNRTAKPLRAMRIELPNFMNRLKTIRNDTEDLGIDDITPWFNEQFNSTYVFLAQIDTSVSNIQLRKRHIETQVYVGAFQYLRWKQLKYDTLHNGGMNKTSALENLLILAQNLLCEIETAINNTGMRKMPMILTREQMNRRLTFRNNNRDPKSSDEVDEIDSKFTIIRFGEYLTGLQQVLRNRMGKQHHAKKQRKQPKKSVKRVPFVPKVPSGSISNDHHMLSNDIESIVNSSIMANKDRQHIPSGRRHEKPSDRRGSGRRNPPKRRNRPVARVVPRDIVNVRNQLSRTTPSTTTKAPQS